MAQYDLRQALLWVAVMVGLSSLLEMLLASVTFAVGLLVFCVLLPLSCFLPCSHGQGPPGSPEPE